MLGLQHLVRSRAHRCLRKLATYREICQESDIPSYLKGTTRENENLIGVYENSSGAIVDAIALTTSGLHVFQGTRCRFIGYDQIDLVEVPADVVKSTIDRLYIHLKSGQLVELSIQGGHGRFRDAWQFLRFLNRVISDVRKRS